MNTTDRLNKIALAKAKKEEAMRVAEVAQKTKEQAYSEHILGYSDRIKAIMEVANALIDAGYPLGKSDCFKSNGWSHEFGIIADGSSVFNNLDNVRGVGHIGGGWAGTDLIVAPNNIISFAMWGTCEEWDSRFADFEKRFYAYVDSL